MYKAKVTKQDAEKLLADVPENQSFWCCDGRIFRNMRALMVGLASMSADTFAYHLNAEKNDFSKWVYDVIEDEKLAEDMEKSTSQRDVAKTVNERFSLLNMKRS
jgi:hypothetical protein